jgi:hypothetical protein
MNLYIEASHCGAYVTRSLIFLYSALGSARRDKPKNILQVRRVAWTSKVVEGWEVRERERERDVNPFHHIPRSIEF